MEPSVDTRSFDNTYGIGIEMEEEEIPLLDVSVASSLPLGDIGISRGSSRSIMTQIRRFGIEMVKRICQPIWKYIKRQFNFSIYNFQEICKRKLGFCIGLLSCVLVVLAVCCTISVTEQLPIIFLRIAENEVGQFDSKLVSSEQFGTTINYTKFDYLISQSSVANYFHSPRISYYVRAINPKKKCGNREIWGHAAKWFNRNGSCYYCARGIFQCGSGYDSLIMAFDTEREKAMGFGRKWSYEKLKPGDCVISSKLAGLLGVKKGDDLLINANDIYSNQAVFQGWIDKVGLGFRKTNNFTGHFFSYDIYRYVFPLRIVGVESPSFQGKNRVNDDDVIYIEYESMYEHIAQYLGQQYDDYQQDLMRTSPYGFAQSVYVNMKDRIEVYKSNDFQKVQNRVTRVIGNVLFIVGFDQFDADYPILPIFEKMRMIGVFFGLIVDVINAILIGLSVLLIYTLLLINVERRVLEMGILRMIGMKMSSMVELLMMQAMMLSLPGVILGLILGQLLYMGVAMMLQSLLKADVPYTISYLSILLSSVVGIAIPIISSFLPIRSAMGQHLNEALDTRRSKTKAVKVEITRMSENRISWSMAIVALSLFVFGFFVYYVFPLALITMHLQLLLLVFFAIILTSLLGLVMLSLNLERIIQISLLNIMLFWEFVAVKKMVSKNLICHKNRNRKTTIMYGISLAFLIFISVSTGLEMKLYSFEMKREYGTIVVLSCSGTAGTASLSRYGIQYMYSNLDLVIERNEYVEDYAYSSFSVQSLLAQDGYTMRPVGDYFRIPMHVSAISPNFYEILDPQFLIVDDVQEKNTNWSLSEQLYTIDGSHGFMSDVKRKNDLGVGDIGHENIVFEMKKNTRKFPKFTYKLMRFNSVLESAAGSSFTKYEQSHFPPEAFISFPAMLNLMDGLHGEYFITQDKGLTYMPRTFTFESVMDIPVRNFYLKLKDGVSSAEVEEVLEELKERFHRQEESDLEKERDGHTVQSEEDDENEETIEDYEEDDAVYHILNVNDIIERIEVIENVMGFFFYLSTTFTMIMCFFSLVSNMWSNVMEQAMEISILRAIGIRKWTVNRIYLYEAMIIIYTAGIIGFVIGLCVSYTLVLQQELFTQLPLPFVFPYEIAVTVFIVGLICGFLATVFPVNVMLRKRIVANL